MQTQTAKPAIFLDRDGVINHNRADYVKNWSEFVFLPGSLTALKWLAQISLPIIVVTNQSAVGRGILTTEGLQEIHTRMSAAIQAHGGRIDAIVHCPHRPELGCDCRKPKPGLLKKAAAAWDLDLSRSFIVGDAFTDIEAGLAVGCQPYLVLSGRGAAAQADVVRAYPGRCKVVPNLSAAVDSILWKINPYSNRIQT